jgi:hypothetical protein
MMRFEWEFQGATPDSTLIDWKPSGKRTKRGLYRVGCRWWYINADCNGAANILRKVSRTLGLDLSRLSRGVLTRPQRISLWSVNGNVERRGFNPSEDIRLESPSEALLDSGGVVKTSFSNCTTNYH